MSSLVVAPQVTVALPRASSSQDDDKKKKTRKTGSTLQSDLQKVFESYAALYPNPNLAKERHDREALIRALAAAGQATAAATQQPPPAPGLWGRLFGATNKASQQQQDQAVLENFDERRLLYIHEDDAANYAL